MDNLAGPIQFLMTIIFGFGCVFIGYKIRQNDEKKTPGKEKLDDVEPVEETEHFLST